MTDAIVRISADTRDFTGGMQTARSATRQLTGELGSMARQAAATAIGIAGLDTAKSAFRRTSRLVTESVRLFTESNEEAAEQLSATRQAVDDFRMALGEAIVGGQAGAQTMGILQQTFDGLRQIVEANQDRIQAFVRGALAAALRGVAALARVIGGLVQTWDLLRTTVGAAGQALSGVALSVQSVAMQIFGALSDVVASLTQRLASLIGAAARAADALGIAGLAGALGVARDAMDAFGRAADDVGTAALQRAQVAALLASDAYRDAGDEYRDMIDRMLARQATIDEIAGAIDGVADAAGAGAIEVRRLAAEVRDAGRAAAAEPPPDTREVERELDRLRANVERARRAQLGLEERYAEDVRRVTQALGRDIVALELDTRAEIEELVRLSAEAVTLEEAEAYSARLDALRDFQRARREILEQQELLEEERRQRIAEAEEEARRQRIAAEEAVAARIEELSRRQLSAIEGFASGRRSADQAIRDAIATNLRAEGVSAVARGGIDIARGNVPRGIAQIGAGTAAVGIAANIGRARGGATPVPATQAAPAPVQQVTQNLSVSIGYTTADPRQITQQIASEVMAMDRR